MSKYFLGVDGGQSSTIAIIGDETGRIVGIGRGGPCNHVSGAEARAKFVSAIGVAIRQAAGETKLPSRFAAACLGFSGGSKDKAPWLDEIFQAEKRVVTHDGLIALAGATAGAPGLIVIAGTGSFAFGRNAEGRVARAGGWGYIYGDEGGGFDITREALRAALRHEEGWGPRTTLTEALLRASGAASASELLHRLYTPEFPRPQVAGWSQLIDQAADAGDEEAVRIMRQSGVRLAEWGAAVHRNLFARGSARISHVGGVFRSKRLLDQFSKLVLQLTGCPVSPPIHGPATGALLEAYREAGIPSVKLSNLPNAEK
jgi:N-acetylglucosamine kinase-like BadF-type ATPase